MTDTEIEALAADSVGDELAKAHDKIVNLEIALTSSRRIGMAIGILMARFTVSRRRRVRHAAHREPKPEPQAA